jgi:predicted transcriptional regulator
MKAYKLTDSEEKFAGLIWQNEPIGSGDLVKLCEKEMDWKKSTTYAKQSIRFVEDTFGGSLPKFLTAFIGGRKLSEHQAEELKRLIDEHKEV